MPTASALRIGYCLSLTCPFTGNGRSARIAHEIWRENVNIRGGLLGRPVELVCYDDHADMAIVDAIYRKLMDEDRVDLVIGGYGTEVLLAAMPVIVERERFFVGLMGLGVNRTFGYPNYFAMVPTGPDCDASLTEGFFELATAQLPAPRRIAIVGSQAEASSGSILGARTNAVKYGFHVVQEAVYPPDTGTFTPILDAVATGGCELLLLCSGVADTASLVRAVHEHPFRPKMAGGAMPGLHEVSVRAALGRALTGFVNYDYWAPAPRLMFPGTRRLIDAYRMRAASVGVSPIAQHVVPFAYAQMQVVAQAIEATGDLDDTILSTFTSEATFHTVVGDLRFGANGEWVQPRVLQVQFRGRAHARAGPFEDGAGPVVVAPEEFASGPLVYPYSDAIRADA
jgi:branched-chain amino acid transport system substrate-binding protein